MIGAFAVTIVIVYIIRRTSIDHSWRIAIASGSICLIACTLIGSLVTNTEISLFGVIIGTIIAAALMLVVVLFYIQHKDTIMNASATTLLSPLALILCAITVAGAIGKLMRLNTKEQRTIIIEVGMQNAAQAIAIASSPFIFHNDIIAVPAIIYSLMMNLVLLTYVALCKRKS